MLHFARWKIIAICAVCLAGLVFALPNVFPRSQTAQWPSWLPNKGVSLGLDLRGGSHLLLEMNMQELVDEWLEGVVDDVRQRLRSGGVQYTGLRRTPSNVEVRITKPEDLEKARTALAEISQPLETNVFTGVQGNDLTIATGAGNLISLTPTEPALVQRANNAMAASIETIRRRVDQLGTTEPNIQRQGRDRILVQVPGLDDPQRLKDIIGKTAKLAFHEVHPSVTASDARLARPPAGYAVYAGREADGGFEYVLKVRPVVTGEELEDAQPSFDQRDNQPVVTFRFNSSGARKFGRYTQANVDRPFAIVLDNEVISAPVIREPILGGTGQISGNFSVQEASNLSILLRSGALPASLTIVEERTVGPSLGADSIAAGEIAGVIGLGAVVVFMIVTYGMFGIFSTVALLVNIILILGALSALQATLTLPGIAGIVLTIGMAVDANVLIYERIREELAAGKSPINAIDTGYSRAISTILDANITTFLAAIILFWLGSGPIRGFAVTLSIGIFTSVFTAFVLTRLMVAVWLKGQKRRAVELPI
ncbi:MAG: protein translocase subunit SecD [Rhizobiales bacterium]|nr:protein translocase subunit SecD [Hyphomicrobiales bacterium]